MTIKKYSIGLAGPGWIIASLMLAAVAHADSVTLKSGRVIEGDIVARGADFVTLQSDDTFFKVRYSQMSEESEALLKGEGVPVKEVISAEEVLEKLAMELGKDEWGKRVTVYKDYFSQVREMQVQFVLIMLQSAVRINQSLNSKNVRIGEKIAQETYQQVLHLKGRMEELAPLEELRPFHEKVINTFVLTLKSIDAWSLGDSNIYHSYNKKAVEAMIASMEEYSLFIELLGSSPEEIQGARAATAQMKAQLEQMYY